MSNPATSNWFSISSFKHSFRFGSSKRSSNLTESEICKNQRRKYAFVQQHNELLDKAIFCSKVAPSSAPPSYLFDDGAASVATKSLDSVIKTNAMREIAMSRKQAKMAELWREAKKEIEDIMGQQQLKGGEVEKQGWRQSSSRNYESSDTMSFSASSPLLAVHAQSAVFGASSSSPEHKSKEARGAFKHPWQFETKKGRHQPVLHPFKQPWKLEEQE